MTEAKESRAASWIVPVIIVALVIGIVVALSNVRSCEDKGEAYFKDLGSWPRLSDGRDAEAVVKERCARSDSAFPD